MDILFVRHGQTDWNVQKKVQGLANIELNETGINQAENARELLEKENIDLIICSPLKRTIQTANIINKNKKIELIIDDRIIERDFGEFEGVNKEEFNFGDFWSYDKNIKYKNAENIQKFFKRVYAFLDDLNQKYSDKKILLVSHGGVSIPVRCYFEGIPQRETLLGIGAKNCEIKRYKK